MLATAFEGYILVRIGRVREGMQLMDEATSAALAGEVHDLNAAGGACCSLIYACESVADYEHAAQWTSRAKEFCGRSGAEVVLLDLPRVLRKRADLAGRMGGGGRERARGRNRDADAYPSGHSA